MSLITLRTEYWTYKPKLIPSFVFEPLLIIMTDYCKSKANKNRSSCVFFNIHSDITSDSIISYGYKIPSYDWKDAPSILHELCKIVEDYTKEKYDYVLVHIYPSGEAAIAYHNDFEALNSSIASVSLGATRKFRFRKIGRKNGWDNELLLNDGDLVWMHGPNNIGRVSCQKIYQHSVPVEKKVKNPRINLTFRQNK